MVDPSIFWEQSDWATKHYVDEPLTAEVLAEVEAELGYKLPAAYVELCRLQNGGTPINTVHLTNQPTSWASDHVMLTGIFSIGCSNTSSSLCGELGSQFWVSEWGYPDIGVYFADCPSAGHDMFCLDYRECGPKGEPRVVHIDQEDGYKVTLVALNFESFIRGLQSAELFDQ